MDPLSPARLAVLHVLYFKVVIYWRQSWILHFICGLERLYLALNEVLHGGYLLGDGVGGIFAGVPGVVVIAPLHKDLVLEVLGGVLHEHLKRILPWVLLLYF